MIFALLFFIAFVVGLIAYVVSDRWWLGAVASILLLLILSLGNPSGESLQGVTVYFGLPIVFLGSLFGAYIVQIRRPDNLEEEADLEPVSNDGDAEDPKAR